jgi:hypothetical protein
LLRGTRIRSGLEDHEAAGGEMFRNGPASVLHERQIGTVVPHRSRHTHDDDVGLRDVLGVVRERQAAGGKCLPIVLGGNAGNGGDSLRQIIYASGVDVEPNDLESVQGRCT